MKWTSRVWNHLKKKDILSTEWKSIFPFQLAKIKWQVSKPNDLPSVGEGPGSLAIGKKSVKIFYFGKNLYAWGEELFLYYSTLKVISNENSRWVPLPFPLCWWGPQIWYSRVERASFHLSYKYQILIRANFERCIIRQFGNFTAEIWKFAAQVSLDFGPKFVPKIRVGKSLKPGMFLDV